MTIEPVALDLFGLLGYDTYLAVALLLLGGPILAFAWLRWRASRILADGLTSDSRYAINRSVGYVVGAAVVLVPLVGYVGGVFESVLALAALAPWPVSTLGPVTIQLGTLLVGLVPPTLLAIQLAVSPVLHGERGVSVTWGAVVGDTLRWYAPFLSLVGLAWLAETAPPGVGVAAAVFGGTAGYAYAEPSLYRWLWPARPPTDEESELLAPSVEGTRLDVTVVEETEKRQAFATSAGLPPGPEHLFVSDYLVDQLDVDELRALLAVQVGCHRSPLRYVRVLGIGVYLGAWLGVTTGGGSTPFFVGLAALFPAFLLLRWLDRRLVFAGDAYATRRFDPEVIERSIDRVYELNTAVREKSRFDSLFSKHPPFDARVRRLASE